MHRIIVIIAPSSLWMWHGCNLLDALLVFEYCLSLQKGVSLGRRAKHLLCSQNIPKLKSSVEHGTLFKLDDGGSRFGNPAMNVLPQSLQTHQDQISLS